MDWSKTLIRCSSLGAIMSEPKSKEDKEKGELSESAKGELIKIYAKEKYGMEKIVYTKQMAKGTLAEEANLDLISRITKKMVVKNKEELNNAYIKGTPDMFSGKDIRNAEEIELNSEETDDAKSSWDAFTFLPKIMKPVPKANYWQLQGYFDLTGAKKGNICYSLVDTPQKLIEDEEKRLVWIRGDISEESEGFKEAFAPLLRTMQPSKYMSKEERLLLFPVERNQSDIIKIYSKVVKCREWLAWFEEKHKSFNRTIVPVS
jgi:hypothetical protein